uniref:B30.2/SPRY domain-containing protein n=1 Tax=Neolamprologus brichardi TaxID=32507 RepID=A0A3Q4N5I0_NEOBR
MHFSCHGNFLRYDSVYMSAASCLLSEDQFLCSICLDVFTDPVSTPCGHNFCKNCISQHWDISDSNDWTELSFHPLSYELFEAELKRVQQYAVDMTLDPDTAHPKLILSDDGKQVHCGDKRKQHPDNPETFFKGVCVLAKQSLSSGRLYFEIQVKEKTKWFLGVVRESINRKEDPNPSPANGYWTVILGKNSFLALDNLPVHLPLHGPEKVGVFVDYEEGLVSFYDVDHAALIYSFTGCSFTGKLYPFFCPGNNDDGNNSAPLIICPVNQQV